MKSSNQQKFSWRRNIDFLKEALQDNEVEYTSIPMGRALGLLAIPMMLEMVMESVFAVVDIAFVSRLGTDAIAAVGITEALVTVLYAIAIGFGLAVTAMVARRVGEKDPEAAAVVTGQAIWISAALSVVVGIAGYTYAEDMLRLMGATESVVHTGTGFATVLLGGAASIIYLFTLNAAFRGAGDAAIALRSLWLANGLNLILDPCLIFGLGPFPEMGVTGAAVATTIGRGVGVLYQLWHLFGVRGRLQCQLRHLKLVPDIASRLLVIAVGGIGQFLISTSSWLLVMRIVALYGSGPIAAYTIALRLLEFVWLPAWGLGNAAATLVGQNLGAGQPDRAEQSGWRASRYNIIYMAITGLLFIAFARTVAVLFSNDPEVIRYTTSCLYIMGAGLPLAATGMIISQALNGAGDTRTPTVMNLICFWLIQLPLAYWLAESVALGPNGVFFAMVVAESMLTVLGVYVFRHGAWKHRVA